MREVNPDQYETIVISSPPGIVVALKAVAIAVTIGLLVVYHIGIATFGFSILAILAGFGLVEYWYNNHSYPIAFGAWLRRALSPWYEQIPMVVLLCMALSDLFRLEVLTDSLLALFVLSVTAVITNQILKRRYTTVRFPSLQHITPAAQANLDLQGIRVNGNKLIIPKAIPSNSQWAQGPNGTFLEVTAGNSKYSYMNYTLDLI